MSLLPLARLVLSLLVCACATAQAGKNRPPQVRDLQYGEVLFQFYKDDYFTAITHLMAAQERNQFRHHAAEAELLLGGLQLSYGMQNEAEKQFQASLDKSVDREVRNRVWYYLGKIAYQRGRFEQAQTALLKFSDSRDGDLAAQHAVLLANTRMALGNDRGAADGLAKTSAPEGIEEFLRINRGIALLRTGDVEAGRRALENLGEISTDAPELRALRDRANLGLGYELLRDGQPGAAREFLDRVRLDGAFAQPALLGAGWADATTGNYENALTPWLELVGRASYDTAVQEAQLAVPFAFEKIGDEARAIHHYEKAVAYFDREEQALKAASASVQSNMLERIVAQIPDDFSGGWLHRNRELEDIPGASYLIDLLAGNAFQEHLKNYRDLSFLTSQLQRWEESLELFHDMVDARREAHQQRAPRIHARLELNEAAALEQKLQDYQRRLAALGTDPDPLVLATGEEQRQWNKLQEIEQRLAARRADKGTQQMSDKAAWLKGVLFWGLHRDYPARLWQLEKSLRDLEEPVKQARDGHRQVQDALTRSANGFSGYDERIAQLRSRILALLPATLAAQSATGEALKHLALDALEQRYARLVSYRSQARYALARNHDLLARRREAEQ